MPNLDEPIQYAGFWRRAGAAVIDSLILGVVFMPAQFLIFGTLLSTSFDMRTMIVTQTVSLIIYAVYFSGFLVTRWQATPGKRLMNVYIVRADNGERIRVGQSLARYAVLSFPALVFLIIFSFTSPVIPQPPASPVSVDDQKRFSELITKQFHNETLTDDEKQFMESFTQKLQAMNVEILSKQAHLSDADQKRFAMIQEKQAKKQPVTAEEKQFQHDVINKSVGATAKWAGLGMLMWGYVLLIALMIGLTRQKTGLHDLIAKTRAVRGVPRGAG